MKSTHSDSIEFGTRLRQKRQSMDGWLLNDENVSISVQEERVCGLSRLVNNLLALFLTEHG